MSSVAPQPLSVKDLPLWTDFPYLDEVPSGFIVRRGPFGPADEAGTRREVMSIVHEASGLHVDSYWDEAQLRVGRAIWLTPMLVALDKHIKARARTEGES